MGYIEQNPCTGYSERYVKNGNGMRVTRHEEIEKVFCGKPHVVILGAGASYASLPNGDKNGRKLPLMNNLISTLSLQDLIKPIESLNSSFNFEEIYSRLSSDPKAIEIVKELENSIYSYFKELSLPEQATIYDYLVLSLREKDVIATFNWDPFLVQAITRNGRRFKMPKVLFLHGNVGVGYCENGHSMGHVGSACANCGGKLYAIPLLYPIENKNYHLNDFISRQWSVLSEALEKAPLVTIFGYGAPSSDVSAVDLLKGAWGNPNLRTIEQIEIIDVKKEEELKETWSFLIHSHHYSVRDDFFNSWISKHPRRTCEAFLNQYIEAKFIEDNNIERFTDLSKVWLWFDELQLYETFRENDN
ncbi:MAG: hypothetical protein K8S15_09945 [Candidatus Aegiribacteria sp.]|nr:hypothetical protein [Candidatus Aegiribacteria sp.]